mgnify:CR=1 FL=1
MNTLRGKITSINTEGHLSLISISVKDVTFKSIVIETPQSVDYLKTGNTINVLFKETEVVIGKGKIQQISMQNQVPCTIKNIEEGKLLSRIDLDFQNNEIVSIITTNAIRNLDLKVDDKVVAMIKTNEIMLSEL